MTLITYNQEQLDYMEEQIEEGGLLNFGSPEPLVISIEPNFFTGTIYARISANVVYVYNGGLRSEIACVDGRALGEPVVKFRSTKLAPEISFCVYLVENIYGSIPVFTLYGRMRWIRTSVEDIGNIVYNGPTFPPDSEIYFKPFMYLLS
jgi:hypothetical protein